MQSNLAVPLGQNQTEDFDFDRRKRLKRQMALEILLSRRERKAIAADMPISEGLLSKWLKEGRPDAMPAHWLDAWTREVGPGLLAWIAKESGHAVVDQEGTPDETAGLDSAQLLSLICRHHGSVMALIIQAREDGVIDEHEKPEIWTEIQKLIRELEAEAEYFRPRKAGRS